MSSEKARKIINEVIQETSEKAKDLENSFIANRNVILKTRDGLKKVLESKCSSELNWIKMNIDKSKTQEYQKKVEEFEKCTVTNDFGFSDFIKSLENEQKNLQLSDSSCLNECEIKEKSDDQLKNCFADCINRSFANYYTLMNKMQSKMNDINKLL